ncbi:MAG: hypothetical protein IJB87_08770 [Alistipes sp.]|nr:hypothetical protein [Alistipes sp.]MBQ4127412.1 hypothetical protein [Alistipes sp.]
MSSPLMSGAISNIIISRGIPSLITPSNSSTEPTLIISAPKPAIIASISAPAVSFGE